MKESKKDGINDDECTSVAPRPNGAQNLDNGFVSMIEFTILGSESFRRPVISSLSGSYRVSGLDASWPSPCQQKQDESEERVGAEDLHMRKSD